MSSFLFAGKSIAPLFIMTLVGILLRRTGVISRESTGMLNKLCFYLLIPCMIFNSAADADWRSITSPGLYVYFAVATLAWVGLLVWIVPRFVRDKAAAGAVVHVGFRPNDVLLGLPVAILVLGEENTLPFLLMVMVGSALHNTLSVLVLQHFSCGDTRRGLRGVGESLLAVLKSPLLLSVLISLLVSLLPVEVPDIVRSPIAAFAAAAAPMALLCIGARFEFKRLVRDRKLLAGGVVLRLVVSPLFVLGGGALVGLSGFDLFILFLEQAMPSAMVSGIITEAMGCDGILADEVTLVSTALSAVTLMVGLALFRAAGVI